MLSRPVVSQKLKQTYVTGSMAFYSINIFGYQIKRDMQKPLIVYFLQYNVGKPYSS